MVPTMAESPAAVARRRRVPAGQVFWYNAVLTSPSGAPERCQGFPVGKFTKLPVVGTEPLSATAPPLLWSKR